MNLIEAQQMVTEECLGKGEFFPYVAGRLVDALFREAGDPHWCKKFPVNIDDIGVELSEPKSDEFVGYGIAYFLEANDVAPVSLELQFDRAKSEMVRAKIKFGIADSERPGYGTLEWKKLEHSVVAIAQSARPKLPFDWKYVFELKDGVWRHTVAE